VIGCVTRLVRKFEQRSVQALVDQQLRH
jgi:hypothetical protein